jgi:hypothetical protein
MPYTDLFTAHLPHLKLEFCSFLIISDGKVVNILEISKQHLGRTSGFYINGKEAVKPSHVSPRIQGTAPEIRTA